MRLRHRAHIDLNDVKLPAKFKAIVGGDQDKRDQQQDDAVPG